LWQAAVVAVRERSWWGWGFVDQALDDAACHEVGQRRVRPYLPLDGRLAPVPAVPALPAPRVSVPGPLAAVTARDEHSRAAHAYGKAYRDVARALAGRIEHAPDVVVRPTSEEQVVAVLDWAGDAGVAVVPYGGGTSVVGGVEYRGEDAWVSLDLTGLDRVLEIDEANRAVRVQAGTYGPALEAALKPHGLTLRHYPQSFELSTVGGWLATRAGGHFATGYTHIDDLTSALRVVTPAGVSESLRVPASGAGPSPDRLFLGSEGALGVITQAWLRVRPLVRFTAAASVRFDEYADAVAATRAVVQSELRPSNCRLLDPLEAMLQAGTADGRARLLLGFESHDHPVDAALARAIELCRDHRGDTDEEPTGEEASGDRAAGDRGGGTAGAWRRAFLRAPYVRDALARLGVVVETVETACTWDRFDRLRAGVLDAACAAAPGGLAVVTCRFTHVYPDGPAPYFTIVAPAAPGDGAATWDAIKSAVSEAITGHGGTITHHHAVGRDHRPWYDRQRPQPYAAALRAAKAALDPRGVLNPGILV
jgi:alkyldihydroxyacetonephosphate synthase